jgi:hypothetical protein
MSAATGTTGTTTARSCHAGHPTGVAAGLGRCYEVGGQHLALDVHKSQCLPPKNHNGVVPRRVCAANLAVALNLSAFCSTYFEISANETDLPSSRATYGRVTVSVKGIGSSRPRTIPDAKHAARVPLGFPNLLKRRVLIARLHAAQFLFCHRKPHRFAGAGKRHRKTCAGSRLMVALSHRFHADGWDTSRSAAAPPCPWRGHGCVFRRGPTSPR